MASMTLGFQALPWIFLYLKNVSLVPPITHAQIHTHKTQTHTNKQMHLVPVSGSIGRSWNKSAPFNSFTDPL